MWRTAAFLTITCRESTGGLNLQFVTAVFVLLCKHKPQQDQSLTSDNDGSAISILLTVMKLHPLWCPATVQTRNATSCVTLLFTLLNFISQLEKDAAAVPLMST